MHIDEITWKTPPENKRGARPGGGSVQRFVLLLQERPGEWAMWPNPTSSSTASVNKKRFPGTEWTHRARPDGRFDVYARWVGVNGGTP